jgi:sugar phosphate isomerase/epimerase
MKLSFMSFTAPEWSLTEMLTAAIRYGYDGIEPRAEAEHKHGVELEATKKQRKEIAAQSRDCGVELCCIATSRVFALPDDKLAESVELTRRYIELAKDCGCDKLRVFGGGTPAGMEFACAKQQVIAGLGACAEAATKAKISLCLETHDSYCSTKDVLEIIQAVNCPYVVANWDIMHPFRTGETVAEAFADLQPYIRHCHIHDGTWPEEAPDKLELALMGEGKIPHDEAVKLLAGVGYSGYFSGEWIGFVAPEIVLPHDARVMREYFAAAKG